MCGRFSIYSDKETLESRFNLPVTDEYKSHYNVTPGQQLPLILNERDDVIVLGKWGLKPKWQLDKPGNGLINARADGLKTKPSFKNLFNNKHCLVIANGFFEWKKEGNQKIPYYIKLKNNELFTFAGLWDLYKDKDGNVRPMFTIITTEPNKLVAEIHNRMPVILPRDKELKWLETKILPPKLNELLKPYPENEMEVIEVSKKVNSPLNDIVDIIKPL